MSKYGYIRVSRYRKLTNTNSPEGQKKALMASGVDASNIFTDTLTSSKLVFPELDRLMPMLHKGDVLMVTTLDRLARTLEEAAVLVTTLRERGVWVHILNIGLMDNSHTGKLLNDTLDALAKYERDMITERTSVGRAKRRESGKPEGRPKKYSKEQLDHALSLVADGKTENEVAKLTGISRSTLQRERRDREAETFLSSKGKTVAEETEASTKAPEKESEAQAADILSSNAEMDVVEKTEASMTALERESEARAAELSGKLSILPTKISLEEWTDSIRELESLWAQFSDNEKIALSLAIGRSHMPKNKYKLVLRQESVEKLEVLLQRFNNDVFAGHLAKGLCLLIGQQKKQVEREKTLERIEGLAADYPNSEGVAIWLARILDLHSCAITTEEWEGVVHRLSVLSDDFKDNEVIREIYEKKREYLLRLQNPDSDY